jgi:hypothetical protein
VFIRGKFFILHLHSATDYRSKIAQGRYIRFLPALGRFIWLNTISAQQRPISFNVVALKKSHILKDNFITIFLTAAVNAVNNFRGVENRQVFCNNADGIAFLLLQVSCKDIRHIV